MKILQLGADALCTCDRRSLRLRGKVVQKEYSHRGADGRRDGCPLVLPQTGHLRSASEDASHLRVALRLSDRADVRRLEDGMTNALSRRNLADQNAVGRRLA